MLTVSVYAQRSRRFIATYLRKPGSGCRIPHKYNTQETLKIKHTSQTESGKDDLKSLRYSLFRVSPRQSRQFYNTVGELTLEIVLPFIANVANTKSPPRLFFYQIKGR